MKILFDYCRIFADDWGDVKMGIGWYKHNVEGNKKFPGWKGFTLVFYLLRYRINIDWISNYANYRKRMDYRITDDFLARAAERKAARAERKAARDAKNEN